MHTLTSKLPPNLWISFNNTLSLTWNSRGHLPLSVYFFILCSAFKKLSCASCISSYLAIANLYVAGHLAPKCYFAISWGVKGYCPITNSNGLIPVKEDLCFCSGWSVFKVCSIYCCTKYLHCRGSCWSVLQKCGVVLWIDWRYCEW